MCVKFKKRFGFLYGPTFALASKNIEQYSNVEQGLTNIE